MNQIFIIFSLFLVCSISLENVQELTDSTFPTLVQQDTSIWIVLFAASWCGHCNQLKPEFERLALQINKYGVKLGHVNEKQNHKLINDYVVNHQTHMVSYPKLIAFQGKSKIGQVPGSLRNAENILKWAIQTLNLKEQQIGQQQYEDIKEQIIDPTQIKQQIIAQL